MGADRARCWAWSAILCEEKKKKRICDRMTIERVDGRESYESIGRRTRAVLAEYQLGKLRLIESKSRDRLFYQRHSRL